MRVIAIGLCVLVTGCGDRVVSERPTRTWQAEAVVTCSHVCLGLSFEGEIEVTSCDGHQRAIVQFTEIETVYEHDTGQAEKAHRRALSVRQQTMQTLEGCR